MTRKAKTFIAFLLPWLLVPGFAGAVSARSEAGPGTLQERQLKAAFVYNFVQFVRWPDDAFADPLSPLVLCAVGEDRAGSELDALSGRSAHGRSLAVKHAATLEAAGACHVLYLDGATAERSTQSGLKPAGKAVLTIADQPGFAARGGMINFYQAEGRIRFAINPAAVQRSGLSVSSKLLNLAEIVAEPGEKRR